MDLHRNPDIRDEQVCYNILLCITNSKLSQLHGSLSHSIDVEVMDLPLQLPVAALIYVTSQRFNSETCCEPEMRLTPSPLDFQGPARAHAAQDLGNYHGMNPFQVALHFTKKQEPSPDPSTSFSRFFCVFTSDPTRCSSTSPVQGFEPDSLYSAGGNIGDLTGEI